MPINASIKGLAKIKQAREEKGWTTNDARACRQASDIIDPDTNWEDEQIKLEDRFAYGVSISSWKRFLRGIPIEIEAFKAFCQILELDYLEVSRDNRAKINIRLSGIFSESNEDKIRAKLREVEKLLDCEKFILLKIEEGSIVLKLQTSIKAYEKLRELAQSGQLQEILGFPIESIELESIEPVDTRKWLERLFNESWQPPETVLAATSVRSSETNVETTEKSVSKAKVIYLTETQSVVTIVRFILISDAEIQVSLEIYPDRNNAYLPEGLIIEIIDERQAIALREEVEGYTDSIQIPFGFEPQEQFKIRLTLENINVTEMFNN